ncbi:hypothetical protein [Natrinema sp. HArc-T2]|uniref:hypothetical protein n=1 Tax=Natrinema sp. HArc-T2 TaxID=3242701 RepID=UPI00359DD8AE
MSENDNGYDKESVNLWVDPERKERWKKYLEEESEFQYLSQLIRQAIESEIQQSQEGNSSAELSENAVSHFDEIHSSIGQVEQVLKEVEKRLSGLEREVRADPDVRQLANEVFEKLPTKAEIKEYEQKVSDGATLREIGMVRSDSGRIKLIADALDTREKEVRKALNRLQQDTHQVHTLDWDGETRYYKEG